MTETKETATKPADQIHVAAFRQIFHWPLSLSKPKEPEKDIDQITNNLGSPWQEVNDRPDAYEEGVYFHDVVQDFLYPDALRKEHRTFQRKDISELSLTIGGKKRDFTVARLDLDLFRAGSAIVTLELVAKMPGTLADVELVIDHARRAFPGYWFNAEQDDKKPAIWVAGLCPSDAVLTIAGTKTPLVQAPRDEQRAHWRETGRPMLFPWWQEIARPLVIEGQPNPDNRPTWRHVLDERIPVMSYISLTNSSLSDQAAYDQISEGDWHRIAAADAPGKNDMPYNAEFLRRQEPALFYDRFHHDGIITETTRHCFAGYHYAMVGSGWFFDNIARGHFSSHYRQMQFIAHLEFATLLTFSRRISDLVRDKGEKEQEAAFREDVLELRRDLLGFIHRFSFTDVSNHLQAREMNRMLRDAMGLEGLRADVQAELTAASDFAMAAEAREATRSQTRLTEFASLFLPASLGAGFAGLDLFPALDTGTEAADSFAPTLAYLSFWLFLAYALGWAVLWGTKARGWVLWLSRGIAVGALGLAVMIWVWQARHGTPFWPDWPAIRAEQSVISGSE